MASEGSTNEGEDSRLRPRVALEASAGSIDERPQSSTSKTRELVQLAWPIATAMLGETAIGLVDTKLVGGLGPSALGGVGVATTLMFLGYSVVFGLMRGVKVRTAYAIGEGRPADGFVYARSGLVMGATLGLAVFFAARDVSPLLRLVGADPAIIPFARDFLAAVTFGAPSTAMLAALIQHRQAIGDSRTPMIVGIGGNFVNAFLGWTLIYGHFGFPALGVRGGGYATAITETVEVTVMLVLLVRAERALVERSLLSLRNAARAVAELGVPTGLQFMTEMIAFTAFTAVISGLGQNEIAGHQIALNVIRVSFLPGVAISEATSVLVGTALGRRNLPEADEATKSGLKVAIGFMAMWGLVFAIFGGSIAQFFSPDSSVVTIARRLLWVAAVFQVLDAVNIVLRGALRGAKDVRIAAFIGIGAIWLFVPTAAYFLGKLAGLGALGGWLGFVGETTVSALLFWLRWTRGGWRKPFEQASPDREDDEASPDDAPANAERAA